MTQNTALFYAHVDRFQRKLNLSGLHEDSCNMTDTKNKDIKECTSIHSISLLPVDFEIISKLVAHRLEIVMSQLIDSDQSGYIKAK